MSRLRVVRRQYLPLIVEEKYKRKVVDIVFFKERTFFGMEDLEFNLIGCHVLFYEPGIGRLVNAGNSFGSQFFGNTNSEPGD